MAVATERAAASSVAWVDADKGYKLGLRDGKLVCQNPSGKTLAAVPKWLREGEQGEGLIALAQWLDDHRTECLHTVERWMLRSLIIPHPVLVEVWADPDWQAALANLVIAPADARGQVDLESTGLLRDIDARRGLGVIDLDGESQWIKSAALAVPHPILIGDLEELRELAGDLQINPAIDQLYRGVFAPTADQAPLKSINDFAGGQFEQLNFALSHCRRLGYPVRGGYATCRVWEQNTMVEARYHLGGDYPEAETWTGPLVFVDENEHALKVDSIGPVTFSEGMRMASAIYAKRKVQANGEEQ